MSYTVNEDVRKRTSIDSKHLAVLSYIFVYEFTETNSDRFALKLKLIRFFFWTALHLAYTLVAILSCAQNPHTDVALTL